MSLADPSDVLAAVTHPDPYPFYSRLRAGPPLVYEPRLRLWIASRADVVHAALMHAALRVRPETQPVPPAIAGQPAGALFGRLVRMNDGPAHDALKPLLRDALAGVDEDAARQAAAEAAAALQAEALGLNDWCVALPVCAVASLLGFAPHQWPALWRATRGFVAALSPLSTAAQLQAASESATRLLGCFDAGARDGAGCPASPLAHLLEQARIAPGEARQALLANLAGLLSQTCEATAGLLGNGFVALSREPGLYRGFTTGRIGADAIMAEVARHDPSTQNTRRFVTSGDDRVELAGTALRAGDTVLLVLAAASRDPVLWPEPDRFVVDRPARALPGFGHGQHACPGQKLALWIAGAALALWRDGRHHPPPGSPPVLAHYRPSLNLRLPVFHDAG
ncbi:cytochrome P450 [Variovorax sp.]|uniref:cytochrome P450 n=1 Tax=Variovorax sp. TaxID=1871043 RepID=UPI002D4FD996|nr:cytochrome P450 [Variovorax sp.]HYP83546.1 cytochrome P450 [Variovorax sp.]